jgi:hypothetical protein
LLKLWLSTLRHRWHLPIFAVMFTTFSVLAHKDFYIIWLLNLSILSEPHEDDSFLWYTRRRYLIYVISYVSDLRQVGDFHRILRFPPHWPTRYCWNIVDTLIHIFPYRRTWVPSRILVGFVLLNLWFCRSLFVLFVIVFCPLMYGFLLPIWYLLTFLQYIYRDGFMNL